MAERAKARRGRPTKQPTGPGRVPLGLRVTADIKQRLDEAAAGAGRSQSQEAEFRLEQSFDRQDLLTDVLTLAFGERLSREVLPALRAFAAEPNISLTLEKLDGKIQWQIKTSNPDAKPMTIEEFEDLKRRHGLDNQEGRKK